MLTDKLWTTNVIWTLQLCYNVFKTKVYALYKWQKKITHFYLCVKHGPHCQYCFHGTKACLKTRYKTCKNAIIPSLCVTEWYTSKQSLSHTYNYHQLQIQYNLLLQVQYNLCSHVNTVDCLCLKSLPNEYRFAWECFYPIFSVIYIGIHKPNIIGMEKVRHTDCLSEWYYSDKHYLHL